MPIKIACGGCNAVLNAPDNAAGKRVKCPKCGAILIIPTPQAEPDFEMVEEKPAPLPTAKRKPAIVRDEVDDEPKPVKRKPKVTVEEDEDDEEEEDDTPRRKRGKKKKPQSKLPLILGIVFGASLLLGIVGVIIGLMMGGGNAKGTSSGYSGPVPAIIPAGAPVVPQNTTPSGWREFSKPEFEMQVPNEDYPPKEGTDFLPENDPRQKNIPPGTVTYSQQVGKGVTDSGFFLLVFPIAAEQQQTLAQNSEAYIDLIVSVTINNMGRGSKIESKVDGTLGGKPGRMYTAQTDSGKVYLRGAVANNRLYILIAGGNKLSDQSQFVKTIFDNFKIKP